MTEKEYVAKEFRKYRPKFESVQAKYDPDTETYIVGNPNVAFVVPAEAFDLLMFGSWGDVEDEINAASVNPTKEN